MEYAAINTCQRNPQKSAETSQQYAEMPKQINPKQKPQANKPYGTQEGFWNRQGLWLKSGAVGKPHLPGLGTENVNHFQN